MAAVLALIVGSVSLVFSLRPELAPDPRQAFRAHLDVLAVETGVSYGQWLADVEDNDHDRQRLIEEALGPDPEARARRGLLATRGTEFHVATTVSGFKRRSVAVDWSLYDANSSRRELAGGLTRQRAATIALDAPNDRTVQVIWVPPAPRRGLHFVRFTVRAGDELLAVADSPRFRVR